MLNLPKAWRAELAETYSLSPFAETERFTSSDGSVRYLFTLFDGKQTEAVYMPYSGRKNQCACRRWSGVRQGARSARRAHSVSGAT